MSISANWESLGVDRATALKVVRKVALHSVPPIRRRAYELTVCQCDPAVNKQREPSAAHTGEIAIALGLPTYVARRALE